MHQSVLDWVSGIVTEHDLANQSTIELGSGVINGSVRPFFTGEYCGVDLAPGNGVDRVGDIEKLDDPSATWHTVISTECLEHVTRPWRAVAEMSRICKTGGDVIITARGFDQRGCWEPHGFPVDAFRYSEIAMRTLAEDAGLEVLECLADPEGPGFFMHCRKPNA